MKTDLIRIIIFAKDVPLLAEFYSRMFGLKVLVIESDKKWAELMTGKTNIAFHNGGVKGKKEKHPKLVFYSVNVSNTREELLNKGVNMGKVITSGELMLCNGKDPEGNVFQISNRK